MTKRNNIVIVCTDQQRTDTLSCYGARHVHTPGFDRIADEGVLYSRAYATSAVCTPSRVSMLSGQYPSRHGVWSIGVNTGDTVPMIQHDLSKAGYRTGLIGKAHLEAYLAPPEQSQESIDGFETGYGDWAGPYYGFDDVQLALGHVNYGMTGHYGAWLRENYPKDLVEKWKTLTPLSDEPPFGGEAHDWEIPTAAHNSTWTGDRAVEFIEQHSNEQPFFLFASFQDPHHPHALPTDFENPVQRNTMPNAINAPAGYDGFPPHFALARKGQLAGSRFTGSHWPMSGQGQGADFRQVSKDASQDARAYYYGMVSLIDQQLLRIWHALERTNAIEDTLIIVTSDHGELLGDHGLWMKGPFHYEKIVNVPLLVRAPSSPRSTQWHTPVSLADIRPTCQAFAGLSIDPSMDGTSLFTPNRDRSVLVETVQDWTALRCQTVVTERYKLTCYPGEPFGELIDLQDDPQEQTNLFDTNSEQKAASLQEMLLMYSAITASGKERISYA